MNACPVVTLWGATAGAGEHRIWWESDEGRIESWVPVGSRRRFERIVSTERAELSPACWREGQLHTCSVLWVEADNPGSRQLLMGFRPSPTLWLATGARHQALWALSEPVEPWRAHIHNEKLAWRMRASKKHADPQTFRVRVPGWRHKTKVVGHNPRLFGLGDITASINDGQGGVLGWAV